MSPGITISVVVVVAAGAFVLGYAVRRWWTVALAFVWPLGVSAWALVRGWQSAWSAPS